MEIFKKDFYSKTSEKKIDENKDSSRFEMSNRFKNLNIMLSPRTNESKPEFLRNFNTLDRFQNKQHDFSSPKNKIAFSSNKNKDHNKPFIPAYEEFRLSKQPNRMNRESILFSKTNSKFQNLK